MEFPDVDAFINTYYSMWLVLGEMQDNSIELANHWYRIMESEDAP